MLATLSSMHSLSETHAWQTSMLLFGVVVQAFVEGLHELPLQGVSLATVHCTHVPVLQMPLPVIWLQSVSWVQGLHVPPLHCAAVADLQSLCARHSTQVLFEVSQSDLVPEQSED